MLLLLELFEAAQLGFRFVRYFVVLDTPINFARQILSRLLVILLHLRRLDEIEAETWRLATAQRLFESRRVLAGARHLACFILSQLLNGKIGRQEFLIDGDLAIT